jgi:serine protease Do
MNSNLSPSPRNSANNAYVLIGVGIAIGAISMAGISNGVGSSRAIAQDRPVAGPSLASANTTESLAELKNLDNSFANLAAFVGPSVVDIKSTTDGTRKGADGERLPIAGGEGSGFIIGSDGTIVTNDHVVGDFDKVTVTLRDGREFLGKVTRAEDSDIAVVKIQAKDLPALAFADSSQVRPGAFVMAIGTPFGLENSVTVGHISALHRADTEISGRLYPDLIQTDASINMGNSGGPLVNIDGQVIGINTAIYSPSGTSAGIGFAIPSNQARFITDQLIQKGKVVRAYLGVAPETVKEFRAKELGLDGGAVVKNAPADAPAAAAGVREGDVIIRVGETPIRDSADLRLSMLRYAPGQAVDIELVRDGKRQTIKVTLKTAPKPPAAPKVQQNGPRVYRFGPGNGNGDLFKNLPKEFRDQFGDDPTLPNEGTNVPPLSDDTPRLGIGVDNLTDTLRKEYRVPSGVAGALVSTVVKGSVAERAGMQVGDVVTGIGTKKVTDVQSLRQVMSTVKKGQSLAVRFVRYSNSGRQEVTKTVQF